MKKKIVLFVVISIILIGLGTGLYLYINNLEDTSFSVKEQQWLENNKNNVVDIYMPSDVAGLTYMGKGVFFDLLDSISDSTELNFNAIAYKYGAELDDVRYAIEIVKKPNKNQRVILEDNYVILTREDITYTSIDRINEVRLGILASDVEEATKFLTGADIEFEVFETEEELNQAFLGEEPTIFGAIVLKSIYLDRLLTSELNIAYHIQDMVRQYVLTTNGDETLNGILQKQFTKWKSSSLAESSNSNLLEIYFELKGITEKERTSLREKAYIYAFVDNGAYDFLSRGKLNGINCYIIKAFAKFANVDMEYLSEFNTISDLVAAFNRGEINFLFGNNSVEYTIDHVATSSPIKGEVAILTNVENSISVSSVYSLTTHKVSVVKDTKIEAYLQSHGITTVPYGSLKDLFKAANSNTIIAVDLENYAYYKQDELANFKISYLLQLDQNYNYIINNNDVIFAELFDFYLEYQSVKTLINESYRDIYKEDNTVLYLWLIIVALSALLFVQFLYYTNRLITVFKKKKRNLLTKDEKIRYVDSLTSLKNRAYLSDNIEKWDASEIYPQAIIVIDLNSIAYINDNFGHEEGDKVIAEAANILIQNQMPKSEIMRTDGNEFLIYMVEYDEKETVQYIKKLNKEFKELSHEFGAAIGYSMINDAIKTIDDAVNEAALDMRTNKEAMLEE